MDIKALSYTIVSVSIVVGGSGIVLAFLLREHLGLPKRVTTLETYCKSFRDKVGEMSATLTLLHEINARVEVVESKVEGTERRAEITDKKIDEMNRSIGTILGWVEAQKS